MVLDRSVNSRGEVSVKPTDQVKVIDRAVEHIERDDGTYRDNLINGLVQFLAGPSWIKIIMEAFVVIVGFLILAGAVNTSMIGSNGVMNRLAEDGVLTPWFLHPQERYGTTHRLINVVAVLQIIVIVASWGDVNTLGEAYAFGVIWSFVFMTLAMVVFRFKDKSKRAYEVPLNIRIKRPGKGNHIDLPIGIGIVCLILLSTALINLMTKENRDDLGRRVHHRLSHRICHLRNDLASKTRRSASRTPRAIQRKFQPGSDGRIGRSSSPASNPGCRPRPAKPADLAESTRRNRYR